MILRCTKCNLEKDESEFGWNKSSVNRNGRGYACKACSKAYYQANKDRIIGQMKEYYANNPEAAEAKKERDRQHHRANKDHRKEVQDQWYARNRDKQLVKMREYRKDYEKRPDVIPVKRIRDLFNKWLKYTGGAKHSSVLKLIGMEKELFRGYIEDQFTDGMTWDTIHIDHYVPLSYFDPHSEEDRLIAWNYRNLRPMFASDNMSKNDTVPADAEEHIEMIKKHLAVSQE